MISVLQKLQEFEDKFVFRKFIIFTTFNLPFVNLEERNVEDDSHCLKEMEYVNIESSFSTNNSFDEPDISTSKKTNVEGNVDDCKNLSNMITLSLN